MTGRYDTWQGVARRLRALRVRRVHLFATAFYTPHYPALRHAPRTPGRLADPLDYPAAAREKPSFPRSCEYLRLVAHSLRAANVSVSHASCLGPMAPLAGLFR